MQMAVDTEMVVKVVAAMVATAEMEESKRVTTIAFCRMAEARVVAADQAVPTEVKVVVEMKVVVETMAAKLAATAEMEESKRVTTIAFRRMVEARVVAADQAVPTEVKVVVEMKVVLETMAAKLAATAEMEASKRVTTIAFRRMVEARVVAARHASLRPQRIAAAEILSVCRAHSRPRVVAQSMAPDGDRSVQVGALWPSYASSSGLTHRHLHRQVIKHHK